MRIIQKQEWAVDAYSIPNTWDYLESLSYSTDPGCDAEVMRIFSEETLNKDPFDDGINVQKVTLETRNKFENVRQEIRALPEVLYVAPEVSVDKESASQVTHEKTFKDVWEEKTFKDVWEEVNALAELLYVEPVISRDEESASQDTHETLELLNAAKEECGKKKKRKQSVSRRLWGRIKKIFDRKKIK